MDPVTIGVAISALDFGVNLIGGLSGAKAQKRAQRRYIAAVKAEQARWDKEFGPVQQMWKDYVMGNEGTAAASSRERAIRSQAEGYMRLAAPSISQNVRATQTAMQENLAARGLGSSGVAAQALMDLEGKRLDLAGQARTTALTGAEQNWAQNVQGYLALGGQRPSLAQAYGSQAGMTVPSATVDTRSLVSSLMKLGSKQPQEEVIYSEGQSL